MASMGAARQRGSGKVIILLLVLLIVLLLAVGTAAGLYLTGVIGPPSGNGNGDDAQAASEAQPEPQAPEPPSSGPARYKELGEAITVNIRRGEDRRAILQVRVQLMARDEEVFEGVDSHLPRIRNDLIMRFSEQTLEDVDSSEGKQALREEAVEIINDILESEGEMPGIEAVYFTDFVTQ